MLGHYTNGLRILIPRVATVALCYNTSRLVTRIFVIICPIYFYLIPLMMANPIISDLKQSQLLKLCS